MRLQGQRLIDLSSQDSVLQNSQAQKLDLQKLDPQKLSSQDSDMQSPASQNVITDLKPGVRDPSRINIFVKQRFLCSLTLLQFNQLDLKIGQALSDVELAELVSLSNYGKLYQRALEWACLRPRSEYEARTYLKNKQRRREIDWRRYEEFLAKYHNDPAFKEKVDSERKRVQELNQKARTTDFTENNTFEYARHYRTRYPHRPAAKITENDIEKVIHDLYAAALLDDQRFAEFYVESRKNLTGISRRRLSLELRQKGVADEIITQTLQDSERSDAAEIQKMILNKRRRYPDDQKLLAYLQRQGFSYQEARAGIECYKQENEAQENESLGEVEDEGTDDCH